MQLAAEKKFCAWRLPAGAAALGRKSKSLQDFLCTLGAQVSDMSRISRKTENRAISRSWVVELRGFELRTLGMRIFGFAVTYYRLTGLELNRSTPSV